MIGQLESLDQYASRVQAAAAAGVGAEEVSFTKSCATDLQSTLSKFERKKFKVDRYLIQWDAPKPTNFVPAALVRYLNPFAEFLEQLYRYHEIWDEFKQTFADHYHDWKDQPHHAIHERLLRKILPDDRFDNSDLALFAEWLSPPAGHILKSLDKAMVNIDEKSGRPKPRSASDLFPGAVVNLLGIKNDGGGKGLGTVAYYLAQSRTLHTITNPVNFIVNSDASEEAQRSLPARTPRNLIYYGAPGTGKSYKAETTVSCNPAHFYRVVFHADYQNSDFIGAIKPAIQEGSATYKFEKGPFTESLIDAFLHSDSTIVLLIEELNRGNAASIFGETFQLLDRYASGESKFPIRITGSLLDAFKGVTEICGAQKLFLPPNFFIIATMNTSDQAVFPLDAAFKRRWTMKHIPIDWDKVSKAKAEYAEPKITVNGSLYSWPELGKAINGVIEARLPNVPDDRYLGPFFLSPDELTGDDLTEIIAGKVLIYLWEDVVKYEQKMALFAEDIVTFQTLQERFIRGENVFSPELNERLEELRVLREVLTVESDAEWSDVNRPTDADIR